LKTQQSNQVKTEEILADNQPRLKHCPAGRGNPQNNVFEKFLQPTAAQGKRCNAKLLNFNSVTFSKEISSSHVLRLSSPIIPYIFKYHYLNKNNKHK
jgi:hypothetical protein